MGIAWKDDLATGISEVDQQHRELFRRINAFLDACDHGTGKEELFDMLRFLDDYARLHFRAEELLQERYNYHDRVRHRGYHHWFIQQLTELKRRFFVEGPTGELLREINRLVVGWLLEHIAEKDQDFGRAVCLGAH